jgi:hypothetical protein
MSSYSLMLILKVDESPAIPPPPSILDMALGRFLIKSSGEVNGIVHTGAFSRHVS